MMYQAYAQQIFAHIEEVPALLAKISEKPAAFPQMHNIAARLAQTLICTLETEVVRLETEVVETEVVETEVVETESSIAPLMPIELKQLRLLANLQDTPWTLRTLCDATTDVDLTRLILTYSPHLENDMHSESVELDAEYLDLPYCSLPMFKAIQADQSEIVSLLNEHSEYACSIDGIFTLADYFRKCAVLIWTLPQITFHTDFSTFRRSVETSDMKTFNELLPAVRMSKQNSHNWLDCAIRTALRNGNLDILKTLKSDLTTHAIPAAVMWGHAKILEWLLTDRTFSYENDVICTAAMQGHTECLRMLLTDGRTGVGDALYHAAKIGKTECVRLLLPFFSDDNRMQRRRKSTTIEAAARSGSSECVQLLKNMSTDLRKPLLLACIGGHTDIVRVLLTDSRARDFPVNTLRQAAIRGNSECLRLLLEVHERFINIALCLASRHGKTETVRMLLKYPSVNPNSHRHKALRYAVGHKEILLMLCKDERMAIPSNLRNRLSL